MSNLFNSNTPLGDAFQSIFGGATPVNASPTIRALPVIPQHAAACPVVCDDCTTTMQESEATTFSPMVGVTKYRCQGCAANAAFKAMSPTERYKAAREAEALNERG